MGILSSRNWAFDFRCFLGGLGLGQLLAEAAAADGAAKIPRLGASLGAPAQFVGDAGPPRRRTPWPHGRASGIFPFCALASFNAWPVPFCGSLGP
jgi:hypothetical protein